MALWYDEVHNNFHRLGLRVIRTLFEGESEFQRVNIIETERFGRALLLDDIWMTSELDEAYYHEYIAHMPMNVATQTKRVLVIGGGDGGTVREILRYPEVEHVDMVEIDGMVVDACKEHLPMIGSAWDDPRLNVTIGDGIDYVKNADVEPYDVVIVDGADPVGPAEGLFNRDFFAGCYRLLAPHGAFATQAESPDVMPRVHFEMIDVIGDVFDVVSPYYGGVAIYPGAWWGWVLATKGRQPLDIDEGRIAQIAEQTHIYNADIHRGAFALPNFVKRRMKR